LGFYTSIQVFSAASCCVGFDCWASPPSMGRSLLSCTGIVNYLLPEARVKSWRVLRLLAIILLIVCWFLVAWTSAVCQNPDRKLALIDVGYTPDGSQFGMCLLDRWDYMMAVGKHWSPPPFLYSA
ncbi:hypothetical protein XENOCAPTIV_025070, partial [Xenoophorus captivus]